MTTNTSSQSEAHTDFSHHNAVSVLDYELNKISQITKEDPDNRYSPKKALLPTGIEVSRIHYVGYVGQKRINETDTGDTKVHIRCSETHSTVNIFSNSRYSSTTQRLADIDQCSYVSVIAKPFLTESEDGDTLVGITPEVVNEVDQFERELFMFTAAETCLDRIISLSSDNLTESQQAAVEHYGKDNLSQHANAVSSTINAGIKLRNRRLG